MIDENIIFEGGWTCDNHLRTGRGSRIRDFCKRYLWMAPWQNMGSFKKEEHRVNSHRFMPLLCTWTKGKIGEPLTRVPSCVIWFHKHLLFAQTCVVEFLKNHNTKMIFSHAMRKIRVYFSSFPSNNWLLLFPFCIPWLANTVKGKPNQRCHGWVISNDWPLQ